MTETTAVARAGRSVAWLGFVVGIAASVAANIAHAQPTTGARIAAAFWPVALLLAVEVLTRVQWRAGAGYAWARYVGTVLVALVAAVMSYRHMAGLLTGYGEDWANSHLGPLAVDGLMIVSGVALLSMSRNRDEASTPEPAPNAVPVVDVPTPAEVAPAVAPEATPAPTRKRTPSKPRRRPAAKTHEAVMREYWTTERVAGRTPTGAELDRVAGTSNYGRRLRRTFLADEQAATETPSETTAETPTENDAETAPETESETTTEKELVRV